VSVITVKLLDIGKIIRNTVSSTCIVVSDVRILIIAATVIVQTTFADKCGLWNGSAADDFLVFIVILGCKCKPRTDCYDALLTGCADT